jgi:hypothetical protein
MKKIIIFGCFILSLLTISIAQPSQYSCVISRNDYKKTFIVSSEGDSLLLSNDSLNFLSKQKEKNCFFIKGKGHKKDKYGNRERHKLYLINFLKDTLATIIDDGEIIRIRGNMYYRKQTESGWEYQRNGNDVVCTANLLWNDNTWNYDIKFTREDISTDILKKVIFLSMTEMAYYRSKCPQTDSDVFLTSDIWFLLWFMKL